MAPDVEAQSMSSLPYDVLWSRLLLQLVMRAEDAENIFLGAAWWKVAGEQQKQVEAGFALYM